MIALHLQQRLDELVVLFAPLILLLRERLCELHSEPHQRAGVSHQRFIRCGGFCGGEPHAQPGVAFFCRG